MSDKRKRASESTPVSTASKKSKENAEVEVEVIVNMNNDNNPTTVKPPSVPSTGTGNQEELLRLLECPVCHEHQVAPIYNCESGHSVCNICRKKMEQCPVCTRPFTDSRNYLAESIAESIKIPCTFNGQGCTVLTTVPGANKHAAECDYRPVMCNAIKKISCEDVPIDFSNYYKHLLETHQIEGQNLKQFGQVCRKTERMYVVRKEGSTWPLFYIAVGGKIFFKHTTYTRGGNVYWWIDMLSTNPEEANEYKSTITIPLCEEKKLAFTYSVPVHHFRTPEDQVIKSKMCACLPLKSIMPFSRKCEKNGVEYNYCWDIEFSITKK